MLDEYVISREIYSAFPSMHSNRKTVAKGLANGYSFEIVSYGSHPCAYVDIPRGHELYEMNGYSDYEKFPDVHGGITYAEYANEETGEFWRVGWDYGHTGDYMSYFAKNNKAISEKLKRWTVEEILEEVNSFTLSINPDSWKKLYT